MQPLHLLHVVGVVMPRASIAAWCHGPALRPAVAPRTSVVRCEDGPLPEDWRKFRAALVSGGLKLTDDAPAAPAAEEERTSVAPANEELLKKQNAALWEEYTQGSWAHEAPFAEAGGLLCRLPLQAQLTRRMRLGPAAGCSWGERMRERLVAELPSGEAGEASEEEATRLFDTWAANTAYTYRLAERLIGDCLSSVASKATEGKVSIDRLDAEQRSLVAMYAEAQQAWQEVGLVLSAGSGPSAESECVVLNRPLAKSMGRELADLLLNGASESRAVTTPPQYDAAFLDDFIAAFGKEAAVYLGGPDSQEAAGVVVHGLDLPGATELAPGTGIFTGGVRAIVDGVRAGTYSPLDFRWFVGRRRASTADEAWAAVACARPIALKQCLGLPKPLWHEVLELCGRELGELSAIELVKRPDLQ